MLAYFSLTSILFLIWILLLIFGSRARREQLIMSVFGLLLAPIMLYLAANDVRAGLLQTSESFGLVDFVFAGSLFGIAAVIYHVLTSHHVYKLRRRRFRHESLTHWIAQLVIVLAIWFSTALLVMTFFNVDSLHAMATGALLVGIYIIADRKDLLLDALLSGVFVGLLLFILSQLFFLRFYPELGANLIDPTTANFVHLGGLPLSQLFWGFLVGFTIGPLYEYVRHLGVR